MSGQLLWLALLTVAVFAMAVGIVWAMRYTRRWVEADWQKAMDEFRRLPP